MNTTKREFVLLTDKFAKILFNTKVGQKYLTKLISLIIDTPVELLGQSFIPLNPHISVHPDVVSSEADLVYENGDIFVNLEINFHDSLKLNNKNQVYLHQLILRQVSSDKDYTNIKKVFQINLNGYDEFKRNEFIYRSKVIEEKYNIERYDNLEIIDINLYKLYEMDYNLVMEGTDELKKMLYLFVCDDNDLLVRLYEGDRFMKKVLKEANIITGYKEGYYMLYHINEGIFNKCVSFINSISDTENILNDITVSTIGCSDNCKSAQMCCKRKGLL